MLMFIVGHKMKEITINCQGIQTEAEFWTRYINAAKPDGAEYFGRNTAAFRDAIAAGGPGWPGECRIRIVNSVILQPLSGGAFLKRLEEIANMSKDIQISID